ncbi:MAG: hypothetical protein AAB676_13470 [Verrucomicrobiota bacterium]|mgnify:CR=1 FL=1
MNAVLPKPLERFVRRLVKSGRYPNQSQVVRDALSRLEQELEGPANSMPAKLPPGTLEAIYATESEAERQWENRTAGASSLKAEAF